MAYRVKGILTLAQRRQLAEFANNYFSLMKDDCPEGLCELLKCTIYPFVILSMLALYADDNAIINKVIGAK